MRVLCASVLGIEVIVVLLATSLATSDGSVENTRLAWGIGIALMVALALAAGMVGRRGGITLGWILQALVLASAVVVGWSMVVVGGLFVVLWWAAIYLGSRVDRAKAERAAE
jgi:high-affinity Fe2+/Pb2+ permease